MIEKQKIQNRAVPDLGFVSEGGVFLFPFVSDFDIRISDFNFLLLEVNYGSTV